MRCPKCGFISFDYLSSCGKCANDLTATINLLHYTMPLKIGNVFFLESALNPHLIEQESPNERRISINAAADQGPDISQEITFDLSTIDSDETIGTDMIELAAPGELADLELPQINIAKGPRPEEDTAGIDFTRPAAKPASAPPLEVTMDELNLMVGTGELSKATLEADKNLIAAESDVVPLSETPDLEALDFDLDLGATLLGEVPNAPSQQKSVDLDLSLDMDDENIDSSASATAQADQLSIGLEEINLSDLVTLDDFTPEPAEPEEMLNLNLEDHSVPPEKKQQPKPEADDILDLSDIMADTGPHPQKSVAADKPDMELTLLYDKNQAGDDLDFTMSLDLAPQQASEDPLKKKKGPSKKKKKAEPTNADSIPDLGLTLESDDK